MIRLLMIRLVKPESYIAGNQPLEHVNCSGIQEHNIYQLSKPRTKQWYAEFVHWLPIIDDQVIVCTIIALDRPLAAVLENGFFIRVRSIQFYF